MRFSHVLSDLKRLLSPKRTHKVADMPVEVTHPNLGVLIGTSEELLGNVRLGDRGVEISINPDGQPLEAALALAESVWLNLDSLHRKCRLLITDRALESYPELNQADLYSRFSLTSIEITGNELAALWYECGDLFGGHDFSVTSFDGASFTDVRVEKQG